MSKTFKQKFSFEKRQAECNRIRKKYRCRIPVIVEEASNTNLSLDKHKYLVPQDLTMGQFMFVIRKRLSLPPENAMYMFIDNTIPPQSELLHVLYDKYKEKCGFLYCVVSQESTFGVQVCNSYTVLK